MTSHYRTEKDSLGEMEIPENAYYGIHSLRAANNFHITGVNISVYPELISSLAIIKSACAYGNYKTGKLSKEIYHAIETACNLVAAGKYNDQFIVDVIQGGAGTSTNMNANEVIANVALEVLGEKKGNYDIVSPLDHLNLSQSTNDVYPTAIKLCILSEYGNLVEAIKNIAGSFKKKSEEFKNVLKMGRTQLQDAVPMTLGQEFHAFSSNIMEDVSRLEHNAELLKEINIGATAIGTGINTSKKYTEFAVEKMSDLAKYKLKLCPDLIEATSDTGVFITFSSALKRTAVKLSKISNDLRLLSSGPIAGLNEINLPPVQAGSSIMPGKVNPVIPEVVNQVAFQVIGNDLAVTVAAEAGQMQLNAFEPVIARNIMQSLRMLKSAICTLDEKCVKGITANKEVCASYCEKHPGMATALTTYIGYTKSAELAKSSKLAKLPANTKLTYLHF